MEATIVLIGLTLIGIFWAIIIGMAIRYRIKIAQWLNAPDICAPMSPDRKECLRRHIIRKGWDLQSEQWKIDDAQAELNKLNEVEIEKHTQ
jgi:hypothetical protein